MPATPMLRASRSPAEPPNAALRARWARLWRQLGLAGDPQAAGDALIAAWSELQRAYHALPHLQACLGLFDEYAALAEHAAEVEFAIWLHDAIYDPRRGDNEARSADWAETLLREHDADAACIARVRALILATRHAEQPQGRDAQLLVDIDLAILGADAQRYDGYEREVRTEYRHVPWLAFVLARRRILRGFLRQPQLYALAPLRARFEAQARRNLQRALSWGRLLFFLRPPRRPA